MILTKYHNHDDVSQKAGLLAASLSQSMVTLFASYSALGGFGLGASLS